MSSHDKDAAIVFVALAIATGVAIFIPQASPICWMFGFLFLAAAIAAELERNK